ncbi:MAG TPA: DUF1345 domain-containing protein [Gemmatimonadales bacterium]|jgi:uncharacterized membrane protein|nr:DUF1345 domain-containing protein [Gemmatimonadales bacterium]
MKNLLLEHPRLWISTGFGCVAGFLLPSDWATLTRILVGWNAGVAVFLILIVLWMSRLNADQICSKYIEEDESAPFILVVVIVAALLSLIAIVDPLVTMKQVQGPERIAHFALAAVTLVDSWVLVPTMFTIHYADMFYSVVDGDRPLTFPGTKRPVFWDFAYFSFTIAAACQTSDVSTADTQARKVVTVHTVISFLFNASILGFAINVTAGLIGGS